MQNDRTLTETQIINKRWNSIKLTTGDAACGLVCARVCVCDCDGHVLFIYIFPLMRSNFGLRRTVNDDQVWN